MQNGGWGLPLLVAFAIGLISLVFLRSAEFCSDAAIPSDCLTNWIGALSGWFATAAGGLTLVFLYRQNEEQRRQTEFLLGDATPTIDAIQHMRRGEVAVVRIVNWNRRPIIVNRIELSSGRDLYLQSERVWDRDEPTTSLARRQILEGAIVDPIAMHGWKNRSAAPCELRLDVIVVLEEAVRRADDWADDQVIVEIRYAGERERVERLRCPISIAPT